MATNEDVAEWMAKEVRARPVLNQTTAAREMKNEFGEEFTYKNKNGNRAIKKSVLDAFNRLTEEDVVWVKKNQRWRKRKVTDKPGRQQDR